MRISVIIPCRNGERIVPDAVRSALEQSEKPLEVIVSEGSLGDALYLVLTGKGAAFRGRPLPENYPAATVVHEDLAAFADWLIARQASAKIHT